VNLMDLMPLYPRPDRAGAIAQAAGSDLNDELTIIFSCISEALNALAPDDPIRPLLLEARGAAQRCAWKASGLLNFAVRRGARPSAASLEAFL